MTREIITTSDITPIDRGTVNVETVNTRPLIQTATDIRWDELDKRLSVWDFTSPEQKWQWLQNDPVMSDMYNDYLRLKELFENV